MDLKERVYSVLVVSAAEKFNASLRELFPDFKYAPVQFESSISAARRALLEREYDFIAVNAPLPDDDGIDFSIEVSTGRNAVVALFVRNEHYSPVFAKVSPHGVYILPKPTSKQLVLQALDWMASTRERLRMLTKKTISLEDKMQEIRIVNRAKWVLITALKMTEADAHRYIEKQAMDRCISKREFAENIIKTYS